MDGIRIVKLLACKMVSSGDRNLEDFDVWFSKVDKERKDQFFPRDFMWWDSENKKLVWYYILGEHITNTEGFETIDFEGGLYAAAISRDQDDKDGERVFCAIKDWVQNSGVFALDERPNHSTMFHVITPDEAYEVMGYRQLDLFVPIKVA